MKIKILALMLALLAFLAACGPPPQTATREDEGEAVAAEQAAAEEEAPTPEPVEEVAEVEEAAVVEQPDGGATLEELEYEVIEEGTGEKPQTGDYIQVHFIGTLADGTEFANSYDIGEPLVYPYGRPLFFEGWDMAIDMMSFGETAMIGIPAALAFGEQGAGVIPPNSDLFFEMELIGKADIEMETVEEGDGDQPELGDLVRVHYVGTLEDGTEFDSSVARGEPIEFVLGQGQVIPGWEIGLGQMREGGKAILTIPPELAYGSQGAGDVIPPNATLIFEVELVEVVRTSE